MLDDNHCLSGDGDASCDENDSHSFVCKQNLSYYKANLIKASHSFHHQNDQKKVAHKF